MLHGSSGGSLLSRSIFLEIHRKTSAYAPAGRGDVVARRQGGVRAITGVSTNKHRTLRFAGRLPRTRGCRCLTDAGADGKRRMRLRRRPWVRPTDSAECSLGRNADNRRVAPAPAECGRRCNPNRRRTSTVMPQTRQWQNGVRHRIRPARAGWRVRSQGWSQIHAKAGRMGQTFLG